MEDSHIRPLFHFIDSSLEILIWDVILLVRIHVTSHYGGKFTQRGYVLSLEIIHYWLQYA